MIKAKNVNHYINSAPEWAEEILFVLRKLALQSGLTETVKWGGPCYVGKSNVIGLGAFKEFVSLWFYQGSFLKDEQRMLLSAQEKTEGLRQWRFTANQEIDENLVLAYMEEAKENDADGLRIKAKKKPVIIPEILVVVLNSDKNLKTNFEKMSPSHQREYCEYIMEAKREATQIKRLEKSIDLINQQVGLNDKYKK